MASQGSQKKKRNPSPSWMKQGPLKATVSFGLKASPSASPTLQWTTESHIKYKAGRRSPDFRVSSDYVNQYPTGIKDKMKAPRKSPCPIKRTCSLDTISSFSMPYLKGEWPRDPIVPYHVIPSTTSVLSIITPPITNCDKFTQTEDNHWCESSHILSHKRSSSLGNEETLGIMKIRSRLVKHKEGSKLTSNGTSCGVQTRISPVQASHTVVPAASGFVASLAPPQAVSKAVSIQQRSHHVRSPHKIVGSVELINQEIERLYLTHISEDRDETMTETSAPDGHRAPVLELLHPGYRNQDSQVPQDDDEHLLNTCGVGWSVARSESTESSSSSRVSSTPSAATHPDSPHTALPFLHDLDDADSPCLGDRTTGSPWNKLTSTPQEKEDGESPNPAKFLFVREPPDGCEKVKIVEESRRHSVEPGELQSFCPLRNPDTLLHIPSRSSAFCPLMKTYMPRPDLTTTTPTTLTDREC